MYSFDSIIRFSELDHNMNFPVASLINYFQDCSTFQSEAIGKGFGYLAKENKAWIIVSWQIHINRFPKFMEKVTISTWPHKRDKLYAHRNFIMKNDKDEVLACSNSIWVLMDTTTLKPLKIEDNDIVAYGEEPSFDMEYLDRKIPLPKDMKEYSPFKVQKTNLDNNNHVNNGQYIMMAEEYLPEGFLFSNVRADYRKSALLCDTIYPSVSISENTCTIGLLDEAKKPFTIVEFSK